MGIYDDDERLRETILDERTPIGMFVITIHLLDKNLRSYATLSEALFGRNPEESELALRTDQSEEEIRKRVFESVRRCAIARDTLENAIGRVMAQMGPERTADMIISSDGAAFDDATRTAVSELISSIRE